MSPNCTAYEPALDLSEQVAFILRFHMLSEDDSRLHAEILYASTEGVVYGFQITEGWRCLGMNVSTACSPPQRHTDPLILRTRIHVVSSQIQVN